LRYPPSKALSGFTTIKPRFHLKRDPSSACVYLLASDFQKADLSEGLTSMFTHFSFWSDFNSLISRCFAPAGEPAILGICDETVDLCRRRVYQGRRMVRSRWKLLRTLGLWLSKGNESCAVVLDSGGSR